MKRICALLVVTGIGLVCCVLAFAGAAVADAPAAPKPDPCAYPHALVQANDTEAAKTAFEAIIKANPATTCAVNGLKELNAPAQPTPYACKNADNALLDGKLDKAQTAYAAVGQGVDCAKTGLANVQTVRSDCAQGKVAANLHRHDDAEAAYKDALAKSPGAACAKDGLGDIGQTEFSRFVNAIVDNIPLALEVLGFLIILGLLALLPARNQRIRCRYMQIPVVRNLIPRQLSFAALDESAMGDGSQWGSLVVARMQNAITRMRSDAVANSADLQGLDVGRADDDFFDITDGSGTLKAALDSASQVNDHTKVVGAVLDLVYALLPAQRFQVGGVLSKPDGDAGATLTLQSNGKLQATTSLVQARKDPTQDVTSADFERLAEPSAVWLQFHLARASRPGTVTPTEAQSYTLNRQGREYQLAGEYERAVDAYKRARELEPRNWAARLNLAVVLTRLGRHEPAQLVLLEAIADMQSMEPR